MNRIESIGCLPMVGPSWLDETYDQLKLAGMDSINAWHPNNNSQTPATRFSKCPSKIHWFIVGRYHYEATTRNNKTINQSSFRQGSKAGVCPKTGLERPYSTSFKVAASAESWERFLDKVLRALHKDMKYTLRWDFSTAIVRISVEGVLIDFRATGIAWANNTNQLIIRYQREEGF